MGDWSVGLRYLTAPRLAAGSCRIVRFVRSTATCIPRGPWSRTRSCTRAVVHRDGVDRSSVTPAPDRAGPFRGLHGHALIGRSQHPRADLHGVLPGGRPSVLNAPAHRDGEVLVAEPAMSRAPRGLSVARTSTMTGSLRSLARTTLRVTCGLLNGFADPRGRRLYARSTRLKM